MISKAKISVASFCCHKVLLLWTKTVYFFCGQQNGFVVASVVFVEEWFCCGKCCYSGSAQPASNPVVALTELDSAPATKCQTWIPWNIRLGL